MIHKECFEIARSAVAAVNMPETHHAPDNRRKNIQSQGIGAKNHKRLSPSAILLDLDQPIAYSEKKKRKTCCEEDVRTGPEGLVNGKPGVPDPAHHQPGGSRDEHSGSLRKLGLPRAEPVTC